MAAFGLGLNIPHLGCVCLVHAEAARLHTGTLLQLLFTARGAVTWQLAACDSHCLAFRPNIRSPDSAASHHYCETWPC